MVVYIGTQDFSRAVRDWEFEPLVLFLEVLCSTKVGQKGKDKMIWTPLTPPPVGGSTHSYSEKTENRSP
jgi:hypothetical protein